jgi:pilus assembly protein Flp/PilA
MLQFMLQFIKSLSRDERGVTALEYAVLAGVVVVAVIAAGVLLNTGLSTVFSNLITKVTNAAG